MAHRLNRTDTETSIRRVIPAQVNFLTIYNPTLGDTDETEKDQIVFWAGKDEIGTSRNGRRPEKSASDHSNASATGKQPLSKEQAMNERLRHIGLARGMADFARNFANDCPVDIVETDRSRIVLHELEKDWWILASIDLTRLPAPQSKENNSNTTASQPQFEYSAREVSPAALLRVQLIKAHNLFLLHHASSLWELYNRLGRTTFCAYLNRYWEVFARRWDVLLHGNPATDVYGDSLKLAAGGELGVGVGEEEWGSGEREVLEGFLERAEGLVECVVGRYGVVPSEKSKKNPKTRHASRSTTEDKSRSSTESDPKPWLGGGDDPGPTDGVIFSGIGMVSRRSLATVSQWMEAIFKYGSDAYGVGENPASRPRQRRKRPKTDRQASNKPTPKGQSAERSSLDSHLRLRSPTNKGPDLRRKAIQNSATPPGLTPGIPAPLVSAVENSLDEALTKAAERRGNGESSRSSPTQETSEQEATKSSSDSRDESSIFSVEGMKNVLSFGYGSSWTLNPNGFDKKEDSTGKQKHRDGNVTLRSDRSKAEDKSRVRRSASSGRPAEEQLQEINSVGSEATSHEPLLDSKPAEEGLQEIDPTPEVSDEDVPFVQRLEQSIGKFLIGLSGDLENAEFEDSDEANRVSDDSRQSHPQRIFLRTLTVELANTRYRRPGLHGVDRKASQTSNLSRESVTSTGSRRSGHGPEPKTSAAASVDGAHPNKCWEKMQVAVYVHQPFIFVFLFELHTPTLTIPSFYRIIHHSLGPLQKPLLQRTDPDRAAERIATALNEKAKAAMTAVKRHMDKNGNAIYDLVYDPGRNTIRTSIPNIPIPNSSESAVKASATVSGAWYTLGIPIGVSDSTSPSRLDPTGIKNGAEAWTRLEALSVHTQILSTFSATRQPNELERTVKTARGWWVLWMKVAMPGKESEQLKEAFLVRKSTDAVTSRHSRDSSKSGGSGSAAGRWLLRDQSREASGSTGIGNDGAGAKSVSEGVGIDARKWVEGLLSLTQ